MRTVDDCTYHEYKDAVIGAFNQWKKNPQVWTPEHCTNRLLDNEFEYSDTEPMIGTSRLLFFLSLGEYEVRHDILEERNLLALSYHIYRYENMERYKDDLTQEEIEEVEKDIAFIKSKVKLPKLVSYEDME